MMKPIVTNSCRTILLFLLFSIESAFVLCQDVSYVVVKDEVYLESNISDIPNWDRSTATETKVLTSSGRDTFFDIFSNFELTKNDNAVWATTHDGRRTLSKMKYLILPVWFNDEAQTPANISRISAVMEKSKIYYNEMSWNRHEISWEFLDQIQLVNISRLSPTLNDVSIAAQQHIAALGKQYPVTHTGIIISYNVAIKGDMNFSGGWGVINGNVTWISMPPSYGVMRHEIGHNYGHPHHGANTYDWRIERGSSTKTYDGWDMMSNGKCWLQ
jgi:hypothetical protein